MTTRPGPRRKRPAKPARSAAPRAVTAAELRALRREIARGARPAARDTKGRSASRRKPKARAGADLRWNPESDDVQRSVAQLVLTIVEFLRQLMERQAIRRIGQKTLTRKEAEAVGVALMKLEETVQEIGEKFGLTSEDLNLDLGPLKLM
ncbi:MAG: gas vesicle protein GvpK [Acidobacteriota bacterium]